MSRVLATLYTNPDNASRAMTELRQRGFRRTAVVNRSVAGEVAIRAAGPTGLQLSLAGAATVFASLAAAELAQVGWALSAASAVVCLSAVLFLLSRYFPAVDPKLAREAGEWMLAGESCLIVQPDPGAERELESFLQQITRSSVFTVNLLVREKEPSAARSSHEALPIKRLTGAAADLATAHHLLSPRSKGQRLRQRLNEAAQGYERVRAELTDAVRRSPAESDVVDWLLDNAHVIRSHSADIRRNLPSKYYRFLPTVKTEQELVLRVYALAQELVANTNSRLTIEAITRFLEAYQEKAPLFIAELWVFPLMIRLVLVEALSELSQQVLRRHRLLEEADFLANRQLAAARTEGEDASRIFAFIARRHSDLEPRFITRLGEHLSEDAVSRPLLEKWIEESFQTTFSAVVGQDHAAEAAARVSVSNAIGSLRVLSELDFKQVFERVSKVEEVLREDPSGVYARSDFATRDRCRRAIELTARYSPRSENETARVVLEAAREGDASAHNRRQHVGYYLLDDEGLREIERRVGCRPRLPHRLRRWAGRHATTVYLAGIANLTTAFLAACAWLAYTGGLASPWLLVAVSVLAVFPASELALHVINSLVIVLLRPRRLPQMDYSNGIPDDCRTLVVVPMMLVSPDVIRRQAERLEVHFLSNQDANLSFALLSDFTDAECPVTEEDELLLATAREAIETLNQRYGNDRFLLLHRLRQWCETEQKWIGWERKRGKLEELNCFLTGARDAPEPEFVAAGRAPAGIRFVITLDSDTQLPVRAARNLVETISHPLNRIELTADGRHRRRGYGIMQPRVSVTLPGAMATRFTRLFTDTTGTDPYCQAVSDVYQDLFAEANYHGKAIYDVQAFHAILDKRFPEQTLLSHDLIEGGHVGVGLASHIELFEKFPETYESYLKREHRWTRGDWQIADWATSRVPAPGGGRARNPLSTINRWKIFDNLRRSLTAPLSVVLLLTCWFAAAAPGVYSLLVALAMLTPTLSNLAQRVDLLESVHPNFRRLVRKDLARVFADIALLPHRAYILADAIVRVWYRRLISRKHLLEWQTADAADERSARMLAGALEQTLIVSAASAVVLAYLLLAARSPVAAPFLTLWIASPLIIQWLAKEKRDPESGELSDSDRDELRKMARRTWRFFDDLVSPENNWLPPDNLQEELRREVARRTSPTNIGLCFTAALSARDFGYLTFDELIERTQSTCATLAKLERYEGHFLNWYDIDSLQPLDPRYVSTVDSGNFVASCWLFAEGMREIARSPLLTPACLNGLRDTLAVVREEVAQLGAGAKAVRSLGVVLDLESTRTYEITETLRLAQVPMARLGAALQWTHSEEPAGEAAYWITRLQEQIEAHVALADTYLAWMTVIEAPPDAFLLPLGKDAPDLRESALAAAPSLEDLAKCRVRGLSELLERRAELPQLPAGLAEWLAQIEQEIGVASARAVHALEQIDALVGSIARFADQTNFRFLYDDQRNLFAIGYRPGEPLEYGSHYDLLASEARLMSFVAIAKGDAPVPHWWHLGRPYGLGGDVLLSWNGSLFEYLMPPLFNVSYENSLLDNACRGAIQIQIEHASRSDVPWGVSESAHSGLDANRIYQYRAFGVPALGMKRGLEEDLVVAPYATMMAVPFVQGTALRNLHVLKSQGLYGRMGFYEAIDYSRPGRRGGSAGVVICAYMAHHQAMSLMALNNALNEGLLQKRFHADPRVRAIETLLFERIPASPPKIFNPAAREAPKRLDEEPEATKTPAPQPLSASNPRAHVLGHESYSTVLTNTGGGYLRWRDFDVTRWRSDGGRDPWGQFLYLRDAVTGDVWSPTGHSVDRGQDRTSVSFHPDRVEFRDVKAGIEAVIDVMVAPEEDVEIRRIALTNRSLRTRVMEITSYCELALAAHNADRAHQAFSKLFVQTEAIEADKTLLASRRPRSPGDASIWCAQTMTGARLRRFEYETDRARFLGRQGDVHRPAGLTQRLAGTQGSVLDPAFAIRGSIRLGPRQRVHLVVATATADSREAVLDLIAKYQDIEICNSAFELSWTRAQLELRYLRLTAAQAQIYQELAGHLLYPSAKLRASPERLMRNEEGQSRLWAYGISGDLPIFSVLIGSTTNLDLVRETLLAHTYLRLQGFKCDLVIVNQEPETYDQPLSQSLLRLIQGHTLHTGTDKPGGVFLRNVRHIPQQDMDLILAVSRAVISASRGSLLQQLRQPTDPVLLPERAVMGSQSEEPSPPLPFLDLPYFNGLGGFTADSREYVIYLAPDAQTPLPWVNVIANPSFGTVVSESGSGFTWAGNSQTNRLTPWHNDPVTDPCSDAIYLRDDETGAIWTPTPRPIRELDAYRARHGQGYTSFEHNSHSIEQWLEIFVPTDAEGGAPVRIQRLRLRNVSSRRRTLTVTAYSELVLGTDREETQMHVRSQWDSELHALLFRNPYNGDFGKHVAFAAISPAAASYTADRAVFLGARGSPQRPAALRREALAGRVGAGLDPCAVLQVRLELAPGEERFIVCLLGQTPTIEQARSLIRTYSDLRNVSKALEKTRVYWDHILGAIEVETPVLSVNFLLNRWLLYQTLSCRIWARSALYQSGGAYGFRDQLQDVMALLYAAPQLVREHILRAASRQFVEGDVQHWWHPQTGLGARTRCSDDMLWLPYVAAQYIRVSGDAAILDELVPFLDGPPLHDGEHERVSTPEATIERATLLEHCRRAIAKASSAGPHGLPLIGAGDWNDGMNRIGSEGRGESVWLAWFLIDVLRSFADLCEERGERSVSRQYRSQAEAWRVAVEESAWDGEWYRRAYFDNGSPVGSRENSEAQIDSLPQSWAVISGAGDPQRSRQAMQSVERRLVDREHNMVLLFTPPFDKSFPHPGYIMGYPPGVRENGGQYTHAAVWVALAHARLGEGDQATEILEMLNPVEHARTPQEVEKYRGEPYVVAADVYSLHRNEGRCGWTWYTGSSGWIYRTWIEEVLGLKVCGDRLDVRPAISSSWDGFRFRYRRGGALYHVHVVRGFLDSWTELDGVRLEGTSIPLADDGQQHHATVHFTEAPQQEPAQSVVHATKSRIVL